MIDLPSEQPTFLFTDIVGSTALWDRNPEAMHVALARHDGLLRALIAAHGGRVFKSLGDGLGSIFDHAAAAVAAAVAAQRALYAEAWGDLPPLRVRIALTTGPARPRDGDYYGQTVNRVARLLDIAQGGQILLSEATLSVVGTRLPPDVGLRSLGEFYLKGLSRPENVFQAVIAGLPVEDVASRAGAPADVIPPTVVGWRTPESEPGLGPIPGEPVSSRPGPAERAAVPLQPATHLIQVFMLGRFRVVVDGHELEPGAWRRQKSRQLFKYLLSRPYRSGAATDLLRLFWPGSPSWKAESTLRSTVSELRSTLRDAGIPRVVDLIARNSGTVSIHPEADVWTDADEFERLVAEASAAADPYLLLEQADRLYAGDYLTEDQDEAWADTRREYLRRRWLALQRELADHRERRGDAAGAATCLERVLQFETCDEPTARSLMLLLARQGHRDRAIQVYHDLVQALARELRIKPSHETEELHQRIVSGGPLPAPPAPPRLPEPPFIAAYPFPAPGRLIGRNDLLVTLEGILARGRTARQVVLIGAPAGTGKSALLGALAQRGRRAGMLCLAGGGYEEEGVVPFGPFHEALSDYLLNRPSARAQAERSGTLSDLAFVIPELRQHLASSDRTPPAAPPDRARLFGAVHAYLRALAEEQPVLLCLEDLHAADAASLALLQFLSRQLRRQPIVIVGTFRTEELRSGRPLAELVAALRREDVQQIDLRPLSRDQTTRLVESLLEGRSSEQLTLSLYRATEGNPLFVEQLLLALREDGRLDRRNGTWDQLGAGTGGISPVVREVIGRRLDRLSESARRMLALAAVLGQTFEHTALLAASASDDEADLLEQVDEAFGAQILQETPDGWTFVHPLVREVLYTDLNPPRRMLLHARVGKALEGLAGSKAEERAAELAHHYALGGRSRAVREKALQYSLMAGRRANALSAYREALDQFSRACELAEEIAEHGPGSPAHLDALEGRGQAARNVGTWHDCVESLRNFLIHCDEPVRRAGARADIGRALAQVGATAEGLAECEAGLRELDACPAQSEIVGVRLRLQYHLALLYFIDGRYESLLALAKEALRLAQQLAESTYLTTGHVMLAWAHMAQGRVNEALDQYRLALGAAQCAGDKVQIAVAHVNIGVQNYRAARFADARPDLEQAITLFQESAGDLRAVNGIQTLSRVWLAEGDLEQADEQARLAGAIVAGNENRWEGECHDLFGSLHAIRGRWEQAEASFSEAIRVRERAGHKAGLVESLVGLGLVFERAGSWSRAAETYGRALDVTQGMGVCPQSVSAHRQLGRLLLRRGKRAEGRCQIEKAFALAEAMPGSIEYAPTLLMVAELCLPDNPAEAARLATQAVNLGLAVEMRVAGHELAVRACLASDQYEAARRHAELALHNAQKLGTSLVLGLAWLARGRVEAAADQVAASATLDVALQQFVAARTPYWQALTLCESANVLEAMHQDIEGATALRLEAVKRFTPGS